MARRRNRQVTGQFREPLHNPMGNRELCQDILANIRGIHDLAPGGISFDDPEDRIRTGEFVDGLARGGVHRRPAGRGYERGGP